MTVCVAAIAAKSKAIVMVSDKAITFGTERPMQADVDIKKILPIGKTGWYALVAGDPSFGREVIDIVVDSITVPGGKVHGISSPATVRSMMHCLKDAYKIARRQMVIDKILAPRMLDETKLQGLPEEYKIEIYSVIADFKISCSLLVCGFDLERVPHLFSVTSPGIAVNHDIPGFHAVGVGRDIAIGELYQFETETDESLDVALYEVFDAKATAELIQGVGYEWDCLILSKDREPTEITARVRKAVENMLFEASSSPYHPDWGKKFDKMQAWKQTVKEFTDNILKPPVKSGSRRLKARAASSATKSAQES
jgi:hypothetical protein